MSLSWVLLRTDSTRSFDAHGNCNGTFTLNETNTVSNDGSSHHGTFTYKFFGLDSTLADEITGTVAATRISAD